MMHSFDKEAHLFLFYSLHKQDAYDDLPWSHHVTLGVRTLDSVSIKSKSYVSLA